MAVYFRIADSAHTQETAEVEGFTHKVEERMENR